MMPQGLEPQEQIDFAVAHLFKTWGLKVAAVCAKYMTTSTIVQQHQWHMPPPACPRIFIV
jgi:hypothetical protein